MPAVIKDHDYDFCFNNKKVGSGPSCIAPKVMIMLIFREKNSKYEVLRPFET